MSLNFLKHNAQLEFNVWVFLAVDALGIAVDCELQCPFGIHIVIAKKNRTTIFQ